MTPEQIALIERDLRELAPRTAPRGGPLLRAALAADPTLRAMFGSDLAGQQAKFAAELETVLLAILGHGELLARTRELGARHARYGVPAVHYRTAGTALFATLADARGPAWTADAAQAWRTAYRLTTETMTPDATDLG